MTLPDIQLVARKTVTYVQEGSRYKERFTLPRSLPNGSTARIEFRDSSGALITGFAGTVVKNRVEFLSDYDDVALVPNGAGFYCYVTLRGASGEDMVRYGTVFRRQLTFPDSPALLPTNIPRRIEDDFNRPQGPLGGRWVTLVGRPYLFDNRDIWGNDGPNTLGPEFNFFASYYARYYIPFTGDSLDLSLSLIRKGPGWTFVSICGASDASSFLYACWHNPTVGTPTVEVGYGTGPDIGTNFLDRPHSLYPQVTPVQQSIPNNALRNFKLQYNDSTRKIGLYNDTLTQRYVEWEDAGGIVAHGKGFRYIGIGGNAGLINSGVQCAYLKAQDVV